MIEARGGRGRKGGKAEGESEVNDKGKGRRK